MPRPGRAAPRRAGTANCFNPSDRDCLNTFPKTRTAFSDVLVPLPTIGSPSGSGSTRAAPSVCADGDRCHR